MKIFKVRDVYRYFLVKFIHFVLYERFNLFIKYFSNHLPQRHYSLRNTKIDLPPIRTEVERSFTLYKCCELIRDLPSDFILPQTDYHLKKKFKEYVLSRFYIYLNILYINFAIFALMF